MRLEPVQIFALGKFHLDQEFIIIDEDQVEDLKISVIALSFLTVFRSVSYKRCVVSSVLF